MATYRCPECSRWRFDPLHLRGCVPPRLRAAEIEQWPDPATQSPIDEGCECGWSGKDIAKHHARSKQHHEAA